MDPISKAQLREKRLKNLRPFRPGQSGNPSGRPRTPHLTNIYDDIMTSAKNRREIEKAIFKQLTSGGMAAVLLLREIAERLEGRVKDTVEMNVSGSITLEQVLEARKKAGLLTLVQKSS